MLSLSLEMINGNEHILLQFCTLHIFIKFLLKIRYFLVFSSSDCHIYKHFSIFHCCKFQTLVINDKKKTSKIKMNKQKNSNKKKTLYNLSIFSFDRFLLFGFFFTITRSFLFHFHFGFSLIYLPEKYSLLNKLLLPELLVFAALLLPPLLLLLLLLE